MSALPDPDFIARDPQQVTADLIAGWEAMTGKVLYPAQVERLLIDLAAYRETLVRIGIQEAAKLNLVAFSRYPILDYLGELVGTYRLLGASATTVLRFALATPATVAVPIPAGTRARGGGQEFATDADATIAIGQTEVDVQATATLIGPAANGVDAGGVTSLIDLAGLGLTVTNLAVSSGGLATEDDERLRARIRLAPEHFAVAGPALAYRWQVMSVRGDVADVGITSPEAGRVNVYPLLDAGLPDDALLDAVRLRLGAEKVRPFTDWVTVLPPTRVPYAVTVGVTGLRGASESAVVAAVQASLAAFAVKLRATLGRDLVPSQWSERAQRIGGVYSVAVTLPAARVLLPNEWADCTGITVTWDGVGDD